MIKTTDAPSIRSPLQSREIGTIFNYNGKYLRVEKENPNRSCLGCFFDNDESTCRCPKDANITGLCSAVNRSDSNGVRFVYIPDGLGNEELIPTTDPPKALAAEPIIPQDHPLTKREQVALEFAKALVTNISGIPASKEAMLDAIDTAYEFADYFLEKSSSHEKYDEEKHLIHRIKRPTQK